MKADEVARYLRENPVFFEKYAEMLSEIYVPHPHGGRAIPLSDRQTLALREKNKALESRLAELLQIGEENDAIGEKMHRLCLALLPAPDLPGLLSALYYNLREDFAVPHAALRVWRGSGNEAEFHAVSDELRRYAASLSQPFCGPSGNAEAAGWFGEGASHVRSVALVALKDAECFGMLALGSEDVLRFYPEMGTLYLKRLGELASAALLRFL
ncbi:MAG TPA: DUF484 family protein [Burkholderiales bacterium]|nr:DUF484 family protein [Burkholderiales bacterium]